MKKDMIEELEQLSTMGYKASYATIDYGYGPLCAWCAKKNPSILHLRIHDFIDRIKELFLR